MVLKWDLNSGSVRTHNSCFNSGFVLPFSIFCIFEDVPSILNSQKICSLILIYQQLKHNSLPYHNALEKRCILAISLIDPRQLNFLKVDKCSNSKPWGWT